MRLTFISGMGGSIFSIKVKIVVPYYTVMFGEREMVLKMRANGLHLQLYSSTQK
jgi:hypothetical protein